MAVAGPNQWVRVVPKVGGSVVLGVPPAPPDRVVGRVAEGQPVASGEWPTDDVAHAHVARRADPIHPRVSGWAWRWRLVVVALNVAIAMLVSMGHWSRHVWRLGVIQPRGGAERTWHPPWGWTNPKHGR